MPIDNRLPYEGGFKPNLNQFEHLCLIAISSIESYLEWCKTNTQFFIEKTSIRNKALKILLPYFDPYKMHKYSLGVVIRPHIVFDEVNRLVYHSLFIYGIENKLEDHENGISKYFNIVNNSSIVITGYKAHFLFS